MKQEMSVLLNMSTNSIFDLLVDLPKDLIVTIRSIKY